MKNIVLAAAVMAVLCSCSNLKVSHNGNLVGIGKVCKVGAGDYGLTYVNGFFGTQAVRENSEMVIETNDGDSFSNPSSAVKTLRTIRFRTGPQITGYLVDLSKNDKASAKTYVAAMPELNKAEWDVKQSKNTSATALKPEAVETAQSSSLLNEAKKLAFCPTGNCSAKGQASNGSLTYQRKLAVNLLAFAPAEKIATDTDVTAKENLAHFITRMDDLKAKGKTTTKIRIESYEIKDKVLVALRFVCPKSDGSTGWEDVECVDCFDIDFDD